jgi:hypothetical protein
MPRGIKNRADAWEVRPIRKAPYVTAPRIGNMRLMEVLKKDAHNSSMRQEWTLVFES